MANKAVFRSVALVALLTLMALAATPRVVYVQGAAFGGPTASEQDLKGMIAQGQQLLAQASALAAGS